MEIFDDFKIILSYLKKYKKATQKTLVFAIFFSILSAIIPYIYGRLVDIVRLQPSDAFLVLSLLGIWAITTTLSLFFRRTISVIGGFISVDAFTDLIYEEADHIINLPLTFHQERKSGEVLSRIIRASEYLRGIIENTIFWILPQFFSVFAGIIILFFVNWQLSLGALIIFFFSVWVTIYRTSYLIKAQKELNKKYDLAFGELNEAFLNIQVIKSCAAEDFQKDKIKRVYKKELSPVFKRLLLLWENTTLLQELVFSLGFVAIFGYAIFLLGKNIISAGVLVMFLGYLNLINGPLKSLLWQWLSFQRGMASVKRARKLLRLKE